MTRPCLKFQPAWPGKIEWVGDYCLTQNAHIFSAISGREQAILMR